jgi:hypothetical protein
MNEIVNISGTYSNVWSIKRFRNCTISERILYTSFLCMMGLGYLMALANMYVTYADFDSKPGFSIEDVKIKYHGSNEQTRLGTAINGIMEPNLKNKADKLIFLTWIQNGAQESSFETEIAPILNRDCIGCHSPAVNPSLPDLNHYKTVAEVARPSGIPLTSLFRVAHIHLFGISILLVFVGKIFLYCEMNKLVKRITIALPFVAMILDVASWFATRINPDFAYAIVGFGAVMGFTLGIQILASIYQMWFGQQSQKYFIKSVYERKIS